MTVRMRAVSRVEGKKGEPSSIKENNLSTTLKKEAEKLKLLRVSAGHNPV